MKLPTAPRAKESDLRKLTYLLYGKIKSGKTTFASQFPDAVFFCTENGTSFLEVAQICDDEGRPTVLKTWKEFKDAVRLILTSQHPYKSIVIDTIDNAVSLCVNHVNAANGFSHESEGAYGRGSALIKREMKLVFDALVASGMGVIFISHERQFDVEDRGVKKLYTDLSVPNAYKTYFTGISDFVFYIFRDANGKRMMRTKASSEIAAGDRSGILPEIMPLNYQLLIEALQGNKEKVE